MGGEEREQQRKWRGPTSRVSCNYSCIRSTGLPSFGGSGEYGLLEEQWNVYIQSCTDLAKPDQQIVHALVLGDITIYWVIGDTFVKQLQ